MSSRIIVKYFGSIRDDAGLSEETVEAPDGWNVAELMEYLRKMHKAIGSRSDNLLVALNREYASRSAKLKDGDEVAIFPPVSGG